MMETKAEYLKERILDLVKKGTRKNPIKSKFIKEELDITQSQLRMAIFELRNQYPILSKETNGGGYWIAANQDEIVEFIQILQRKLISFEGLIRIMNSYLADYGSIPYID